jgi:deaminated glutathione amidase
MKTCRVAALQMVSTADPDANLASASRLIAQAASGGARMVVLPEAFACYDSERARQLALAERQPDGPIRRFLADAARRHGIILVGGTVPVADVDGSGLPRAACFVHDEDGREIARYDKMHLFDVDLPDAQRSYRESASYAAGTEVVSVATSIGMLGLAVCYDLRFPELFRVLRQRGMALLALPSAFTRLTGAAHWQVLLRARAIENQVYVIAPDQGGRHTPTRETYGGSVIIDPWGRVLGSAAQGEAVVTAEVDARVLADVRARLPVHAHQRIYVPD